MTTSYKLKTSLLANNLTTLATMIKEKDISPVDVITETLKNIQTHDAELNSYILVLEEEMLKQAHEAEEAIMRGEYKGALHGIPIAIKDMIFTKDIQTTLGSKLFANYIPEKNAAVVEYLHKAGVIMTGKVNTHEFAFGTTGDVSHYGAVKNPHNPKKIVGGSSSGSAAAVAANLCVASIGTDTGGSIRIPAAFCGLVGMKPTYNKVSKEGVQDLAPFLDHVGPMTKNVQDNALLLHFLQGEHGSLENILHGLNKGVRGLRIGVPELFFYDNIEAEMSESMATVLKVYEELGATIVPLKIHDIDNLSAAHRTVMYYETYQVHKNRLAEMDEGEIKSRILLGKDVSEQDYIREKSMRRKGLEIFNDHFQEVDVLLTPVTPISQTDLYAREVNLNGEKVHIFSVLNKLTGVTNLTGSPSLAVPGGVNKEGLPFGFQLIGKEYDEQTLYRVGYAFEQAVTESQ